MKMGNLKDETSFSSGNNKSILIFYFYLILLLALLLLITFLYRKSNSFAKKNNLDIFVSLKTRGVNARAGPGRDFRILYNYRLNHMPLRVLGEYDKWLKVVDWNGDISWVKESLTSKTRYVLTLKEEQLLYFGDNEEAFPIGRIRGKLAAKLLKCKNRRCEVKIGKIRGWLNGSEIWGN